MRFFVDLQLFFINNNLLMTLKQRIDEDIKQAMRDKNQDTLRALRAVKSLILLEETKEGAAAQLTA
jgi:uncharacterized protein YqeY